jgi:hypothetical protein
MTMGDEHYWAILVLVWVFGWALIWLQRRRASESLTLKRREMLHLERLAAIEKGVPLPELPAADDDLPGWLTPEVERARGLWLRRICLALGLLATTTGVGLCIGFYFAPDRGFNAMWTLGFIPMMAGIGLVIFWGVAAWSERSS